jgi:hypothetical protein
MMPLMMTRIMQAAGTRSVGSVMSLVTLPTALGPVIGLVLGGIILGVGDLAMDASREHPVLRRRALLTVKSPEASQNSGAGGRVVVPDARQRIRDPRRSDPCTRPSEYSRGRPCRRKDRQ